VAAIEQACDDGARKFKACEMLDISLRTFERWRQEKGSQDKRKNAEKQVSNKLTPQERAEVLTLLNSEAYCDLPPCKVVPLLANKGIYIASESTMYRLLREEDLLTHRQKSQKPKHNRPQECVARAPGKVWSWDITYLPTTVLGQHYYLYMVMDIYSRKIVGWSIHENQTAQLASNLMKQACIDEKIEPEQLTLHSDNGSPMKGATMLATLQNLGVMPSFSRPSVSDDNPFSEALFKTVKYHPSFPAVSKFDTIEESRAWSEKFVFWYNHLHLHSALKFVTPEQRHVGDDVTILKNRQAVYESAKLKQPLRWSKNTRNWTRPDVVRLNPNRKKLECNEQISDNLKDVA
jgi:transposase InsO family protein